MRLSHDSGQPGYNPHWKGWHPSTRQQQVNRPRLLAVHCHARESLAAARALHRLPWQTPGAGQY